MSHDTPSVEQPARAGSQGPSVGCLVCGAPVTTDPPSGCCSARCRAEKSRRVRRDRILRAVDNLDRARAELAAALREA